ncbi:MAG TPA: hypothetical protein VF666_06815 [Pyrinomonadaceae bacterium]|jgi:hypothetical protein
MNPRGEKKIVLLGMMSKMPVAGVVWQTLHYLVGFRRLGFDVYYVEAHGITPTKHMRHATDDAATRAAAFIDRILTRFDFGNRWAFHALHEPEARCFGMDAERLRQLYASAELIINLHGGTVPLPEHSASGRLVYLETDPVELQVQLYHNERKAIDVLEPHAAFFTFGENYGRPDCLLPVSERFRFQTTRQPIVLDFWQQQHNGTPPSAFTTIGNWQQQRQITFQGEIYHWSKHLEFCRFVDLPERTSVNLELALCNYDDAARLMLESKGWRVRDAMNMSTDIDAYRRYITESRGEFTVAKDQNVRLRSGWFSDRSATYLAASRPVVTQETGFSNILPTGRGLFAFSTLEEIEDALARINSSYERHCRAAHEIAHDFFDYRVVLSRLLSDIGL